MIIFATGISGSGRYDYLKEVESLSKGKIRVIDIGSLMFEKSRQLGIEIPEGKILDMDPFALSYLRAAIFEEILKIKDDYEGYDPDTPDLIISTHVCFRWRKHLLPAFNFYYVNQLNPDLFVTIIDNVHYVKARLEARPHWRGRLTLKDIVIWRDEEIFITEMLAQYQQKPFYIISRNEPPQLLYDIINRVEKPKKRGEKTALKVYLSYPITHMRTPEWLKKKDEFKEKLRSAGIVVFDPITVEEVDIITEAEKAMQSGATEIEVKVNDFVAKIPVKEIEDTKDDIIDQVVIRDYKLIDQSDAIIVYYPIQTMSPGVLSEMNYGFTHNKEVYAVFPHKLSPFMRYYTTKIFSSAEELLEYLSTQGII